MTAVVAVTMALVAAAAKAEQVVMEAPQMAALVELDMNGQQVLVHIMQVAGVELRMVLLLETVLYEVPEVLV
jgi:hypothetical protein